MIFFYLFLFLFFSLFSPRPHCSRLIDWLVAGKIMCIYCRDWRLRFESRAAVSNSFEWIGSNSPGEFFAVVTTALLSRGYCRAYCSAYDWMSTRWKNVSDVNREIDEKISDVKEFVKVPRRTGSCVQPVHLTPLKIRCWDFCASIR